MEAKDETEGTLWCQQEDDDKKSTVAEHKWENHHSIHSDETVVLHGQELLGKETLFIQMTPSEEKLNWDRGAEAPDCCTTVMRSREGEAILMKSA